MKPYTTLLILCNMQFVNGEHLKETDLKTIYPALSFCGVGYLAVRDYRYRLIRYEDGFIEFYDMKKDPDEWKNLAEDVSMYDEINRMNTYIPEYWASLSSFSSYNFNPYFKEKSKNIK